MKILLFGGTTEGRLLAKELSANGHDAVSYTHLDVYKRQASKSAVRWTGSVPWSACGISTVRI